MLNTGELLSTADSAGFQTTVIRMPDVDLIAGCTFSVCIAAPYYDSGDRYRSFNLRRAASRDLIERNAEALARAASTLSPAGLFFVYGLPAHLPRYAAALSDSLEFRYWVAIRAMTAQRAGALRPEHMGMLLFSRTGATLGRVRIPHARCRNCRETLKDWGGKSHLMRADGVALSDVWMDLVVDPEDPIPAEVFARTLQLASGGDRDRLLVIAPGDPDASKAIAETARPQVNAFNPLVWSRRAGSAEKTRSSPDKLINRLHRAPCFDVLRQIPSATIDLAFADPPFNLTKDYNGYSDDREPGDYTGWCKRWLVEYERVLRPGGAMFILNLPRWAVRLADFLTRSRELFLQNWIVWDSLPEPKGLLMPAHYSLLYFTKGARAARFNYCSMENGWEPFDEAVFPPDRPDVCRRRSCVRGRRAAGRLWRGELTDIWHDIHRERKAARHLPGIRAHPCRTPDRLIDRIIRLTTNPDDLVLDAFAGVGTTALVARRLGRNFIAIEQDESYLNFAALRMSESKPLLLKADSRASVGRVSKRKLQLELRRLALGLGRLPTKLDVEQFSKYRLEVFESAFKSWRVALKAALAALEGVSVSALNQAPGAQLEMFNQPQRAGAEIPDLDYDLGGHVS
jgi:site-specific DNA-methyltransferase (adenine-specific)